MIRSAPRRIWDMSKASRHRKFIGPAAVAVAGITLGTWFWLGPGNRLRENVEGRPRLGAPTQFAGPAPASARLAEATGDGIHYVPDVIALARRLNDPATDGEFDLGILQELFQTAARFSKEGVPEGGNNAEITASMLGRNRQRLAVIPRDLPALDAEGRLLDRWGRPYFMHPVSSYSIEVRSAGPDGALWNADDLVSGEEEYIEPFATDPG